MAVRGFSTFARSTIIRARFGNRRSFFFLISWVLKIFNDNRTILARDVSFLPSAVDSFIRKIFFDEIKKETKLLDCSNRLLKYRSTFGASEEKEILGICIAIRETIQK